VERDASDTGQPDAEAVPRPDTAAALTAAVDAEQEADHAAFLFVKSLATNTRRSTIGATVATDLYARLISRRQPSHHGMSGWSASAIPQPRQRCVGGADPVEEAAHATASIA